MSSFLERIQDASVDELIEVIPPIYMAGSIHARLLVHVCLSFPFCDIPFNLKRAYMFAGILYEKVYETPACLSAF